jgi:hypothetical protein
MAHKIMLALFALLILRQAEASRKTPARDPDGVAMVKAIIERRYAEALPLSLLAKKAGRTPMNSWQCAAGHGTHSARIMTGQRCGL